MRRIVLLIVLLVVAHSVLLAQSSKKIALVIGNSTYLNAQPLRNPANDALAMEKALTELGFAVTSSVNVHTFQDMIRLIRDFGKNLENSDVGLFYYAGHGLQFNGKNYLIPVNADIRSDSDIELEGVDLDRVLIEMENARNTANIVILDACRNNPFTGNFRSLKRGLATVAKNVPGCFISYATQPDGVAEDGDGSNGVFTDELLKVIRIPNLKVEDAMKQVRLAVLRRTKNKQNPWDSSSLTSDLYFSRDGSVPIAKTETNQQAPASVPRTVSTQWMGAKVIVEADQVGEFFQNFESLFVMRPGQKTTLETITGEHIFSAIFNGQSIADTVYVMQDDNVNIRYSTSDNGVIKSLVSQSAATLAPPILARIKGDNTVGLVLSIQDNNKIKTNTIIDRSSNGRNWQNNIFQSTQKINKWTDLTAKGGMRYIYRARSVYRDKESDSSTLPVFYSDWKYQHTDWKLSVVPQTGFYSASTIDHYDDPRKSHSGLALAGQLLYNFKYFSAGIFAFHGLDSYIGEFNLVVEKEFYIGQFSPVISGWVGPAESAGFGGGINYNSIGLRVLYLTGPYKRNGDHESVSVVVCYRVKIF